MLYLNNKKPPHKIKYFITTNISSFVPRSSIPTWKFVMLFPHLTLVTFDLTRSKTGELRTQSRNPFKVELCSSFVRLHSRPIVMHLFTKVKDLWLGTPIHLWKCAHSQQGTGEHDGHYSFLLTASCVDVRSLGTRDATNTTTVHVMDSKWVTSASSIFGMGSDWNCRWSAQTLFARQNLSSFLPVWHGRG